MDGGNAGFAGAKTGPAPQCKEKDLLTILSGPRPSCYSLRSPSGQPAAVTPAGRCLADKKPPTPTDRKVRPVPRSLPGIPPGMATGFFRLRAGPNGPGKTAAT